MANSCWRRLFLTVLVLSTLASLIQNVLESQTASGNTPIFGLEAESKVTSVGTSNRDVSETIATCPLKRSLTPVYVCKGSSHFMPEEIYLTLFTTLTYQKKKIVAYNRTLDLWPQLGPDVKPVLFIAPSKRSSSSDYSEHLKILARGACEKGWDVLVAPHCNYQNYPILSGMFLLIQEQYKSFWSGYSNGDILFPKSFMQTLRFLEKQNATDVDFVLGRRHKVVIPENRTVTTLADVPSLLNNTTADQPNAQDFFITRKGHYAWNKFLPFVVGRAAYDNWLTTEMYLKKMAAVDISATDPVLHQSVKGVPFDFRSIKVDGNLYNQILYGTPHRPSVCFTHCMRYMTARDSNSSLILKERIWRDKQFCQLRKLVVVA